LVFACLVSVIKCGRESIIQPVLVYEALSTILKRIGATNSLVCIRCIGIRNTITVSVDGRTQRNSQGQTDHQLDVNHIDTSITIHITEWQCLKRARSNQSTKHDTQEYRKMLLHESPSSCCFDDSILKKEWENGKASIH